MTHGFAEEPSTEWILLIAARGRGPRPGSPVASRIVDNRGRGVVLDVVLGIAGALAGGFLLHLIGATGTASSSFIAASNAYSL